MKGRMAGAIAILATFVVPVLAQTTTPTSTTLGNPTINKNGQVLSHDGSGA